MALIIELIIVCYHSADDIDACLEAICADVVPEDVSLRITVVNNGPEDVDYAAIAHKFGASYLKAPENLGYAGGNNLAGLRSDADYLGFINPDVRLKIGWFHAMTEAISTYGPNYEMFGSVQWRAREHGVIDGAGDGLSLFGFPFRMGYLRRGGGFGDAEIFAASGAAMIIHRARFCALGGFEERFFCYCEDVDLAGRLRLLDGRALLVGQAHIVHKGSATLGERSNFALYHGYRNRLWLYFRLYPKWLIGLSLLFHLVMIFILLLKDAKQGRAKVALLGLADGLKGLSWALKYRQRMSFDDLGFIRALTWNPLKLWQRGIDHRSLDSERD